MGFFGPTNLYTSKQISFKDAKNSSAMQDLLKKEGMSKILDKPEERNEFYASLQKNAAGKGVTLDTIRQTLGDFRQGRGKNIDKKEAMQLAGKLVPNQGFTTKRYIFKKSEAPQTKPIPAGRQKTPIQNAKPVNFQKTNNFQRVNSLKTNSLQFNRNFSNLQK